MEQQSLKSTPLKDALILWGMIAVILAITILAGTWVSSCGTPKYDSHQPAPTPVQTPVVVTPSPGPSSGPVCNKVTFNRDVLPLVQKRCASCHGGFTAYATATKLVTEWIRRVNLSSDDPRRMPKFPLPELDVEEKTLLQQWKSDGLIEDENCQAQVNGSGIDFDFIESNILRDLARIERADQPFIRYLVSSDLDGEDVGTSKRAVDKLLNSLVKKSRDINLATVIDEKKTIYRIDLRTYELDRFNWLQIEAKDKLNLVSKTNKGKTIQLLVSTRKPWLHSRNFIEIVTNETNIYYDILKIPDDFRDLTLKLGAAYDKDLLDLRATLIGTNRSPLTTQKNRLLSRHESDDGFLWTTYDIVPNGDNLFDNPLLEGTRSKRVFRFDASELIFSLPNGLMGFALFNANGKRQNEAPVEIVRDYLSPVFPAPRIVSPVSCFRCHGGGILETKDEIRDHVISNGSEFNVDDIERVKSLYKREESNRVIFALDNKRYALALEKLGISRDLPDPINVIRDDFRLNWDIKKLSAFLFLSEQRFFERLNQSDILREKVGQLLTGGNVTFEQLVSVLPVIVQEFKLFEELQNGE